MELKIGTIVRSVAGHDKGDVQIVISLEKDNVMVCDGKRRKLECPKKKNIKHIETTKTILKKECFLSNRAIRDSIKEFRSKIG